MADKYSQFPQSNAILDLLNSAKQIQSSIQVPKDIYTQRGQSMEDFFSNPDRMKAYEKAFEQPLKQPTVDTSKPVTRAALPSEKITNAMKNISPSGKGLLSEFWNGLKGFWMNLDKQAWEDISKEQQAREAGDYTYSPWYSGAVDMEIKRGVASAFGANNQKTEISDTTAGRLLYSAGRAFGETIQMLSLEPMVGKLAFKLSKALRGVFFLNPTISRLVINGLPRALAWGIRGSLEETGKEIINKELSAKNIAIAGLKDAPFGLISAVSGASANTINRIIATGGAYGGYEAFRKILEDHKIDKKDIPDILTAVAVGAILAGINAPAKSREIKAEEMDEWNIGQATIRASHAHPDATPDELRDYGILYVHGLHIPKTPPAIIQQIKSATSLDEIDGILKEAKLVNLEEVFHDLQSIPVHRVASLHPLTNRADIKVLIDKIQELGAGIYQTVKSGVKTPKVNQSSAPSNIVSNAVSDVASKLNNTPASKTDKTLTPEVNISKTQQTNTPKVKVQDVLKTIKNMEAKLKDTEANVSQPVPIWDAIPEISNKFNITEEQAKQILLKLNDKNKIYIQKFEHPGYLPEEERKYLIPSGNEYLGLISTKKPVVVEPITDKNVIRNQIMNDLKNKVINEDIGVIELNGYLKNHNFSQDIGQDVWKELTLTPEKIRTKISELEKKAEELYKQKEPRNAQEVARKHAIETSIKQHIESLKKTLAEYKNRGESRPEQLSKEYESLNKNIKTTPQYNQRFDLEASSQRVAGEIRNNQIINNVKTKQVETQNVAVEPSETQPKINDQDVINIVREFDSVFNYGNSVPTWEVIPEMMKKFKISKEEADRVLLNLDDKEIIHLQRYDNPDILPDKLRQYLIPWQDTNFGFITVRGVLQPVAKSETTETKTVKTKKAKKNSGIPNIIHRKIPVEKYYTNEVKSRGGIRPYSDSEQNKYEIEEYLDGVPIFLRNKNGLPPDEMADELGFENEAQLYQVLKAENDAKPETFDEVMASELRVGDKFYIDGELYKVVRQTPEYTYLQDGELITVKNDETVQFDTGTFSRTQNSEQKTEQNVAPNIKIEEPSKETIVVNASQEVNTEVKEKQKELLEKLERKARGLSELTERMSMDLQILYGDDPESAHWVREKYKLGKNNDKAIDKLDKMIYDKEQELKNIQGEIIHLKDKLGEVLKERKGSLTVDKEELNSGLKRIADFLRKKLHPETTKEVQDFATFVEQWRIAINWGNYQAQQYADALRIIGNKRKYLEIVDSYLDNPEKYASEFEKLPEQYKEIAQALKDGYRQMSDIARENGILDEVIENYTPHIYTDDPAEVYKLLFPKGGKLGRKFSFNYDREIPTEDEAIKLGLHPLKDPILKFQIYLGQMYKTIANIELYKQLTITTSSYGLPLLSPEPKDNKELLRIWSKIYKPVNVPSFGMGSLRAHPDIANAINEIFAPYRPVHALIHEYNVLSGVVKRALLINPLYHTLNLLTVFLNEVNFSPQALAKLFGNIPQDIEERAIKAGLEITKYSNSLREQLYNELKKTTLFDQVLSPFIWVEGQSDKLLWDKILPKFQLVAFAKLTEAVKKEHPDWTQERIDKTVADELNIAYGTIPKTWTNQLAQQYAPFFLLTYKWNVAVFDPLVRTLSGGGRGMGSGIFPEWEKKHLNKQFKGFVLKSLLAFFLISNLVQVTGLFVSNKLKQLGILKGRPRKVHFMFQNEIGHKFDLDLGFIAADGSVDYIPLPLYKNVRDWIGMVMNPSKTIWNKLAPIPKVMFEEAANYSVWKQNKIVQGEENIWRRIGERILYAVNQLLPSSYYTEQPGRVKTTAEWVLPILGMWMSKGTPGGDIEKLYYQYEAERKQGKNDIDTQVNELLQRNKIRDAVMLMYQNGYSSQAISNRILKFRAPVTYFWLNISNPEKIKFLQFLQKHGKSTKDISNQIKSELEYANQGVP